jgi:hypothetical protein
MAATYQSSQTNSSSAATVVVTKPVSLAVGDMMIGFVAVRSSSDAAAAVTTLSGWTSIGSDGDIAGTHASWRLMYKVADSGDVAASNFTFAATGTNITSMIGAISRLTNVAATTDQIHNTGGTGTTPTDTGITPGTAYSLLMILLMNKSAADRTVSGYAITTSNPSWTEAYDVVQSTDHLGIAMAYATRPEITATGSTQATFNGAVTGEEIIIVNIAPVPFTLTASTGSFALTGTNTATKRNVVHSVGSFLLSGASIVRGWGPKKKSTTTWTNTNKT